MVNEKDIVQEAHKREMSDSFSVTKGTAATTGAVKCSVYFDLLNPEEAGKKLTNFKNMLKTLRSDGVNI